MIKILDLFSGIGGFSLAAQMVNQSVGHQAFKTTQFVEIDPYCQKVLAKNFPGVPIHGDIKTFAAKPGNFDCIVGGFPCQPHSVAGKKQASKDERDLWPELYRIVCEVQPRWVVLENVRGLLSSEAGRFFRGILWDLARSGFDAEWAVIPASDLGACHRRERVWIVAYHQSIGCRALRRQVLEAGPNPTPLSSPASAAAHSHIEYQPRLPSREQATFAASRISNQDATHPNGAGLEAWKFPAIGEAAITQLKQLDGSNGRGFTVEPLLRKSDARVSGRVDRLRALGNAVVPQCAAIPLTRVLQLEACNA